MTRTTQVGERGAMTKRLRQRTSLVIVYLWLSVLWLGRRLLLRRSVLHLAALRCELLRSHLWLLLLPLTG